jgi:hypothetical protein
VSPVKESPTSGPADPEGPPEGWEDSDISTYATMHPFVIPAPVLDELDFVASLAPTA